MSNESFKTVEEGVRESNEFMRALFESAPDAILVIDASGQIMRFNAQAEQMFQYDRQELIGRSIEVLLPERFRMEHAEHRAQYFSQPRTRLMGAGIAMFGLRKDNSEFPVDIMLSSLKADPADMVIAVIRDITERKMAEIALQHSEENLRLLVEGVKDFAIFMLDPEGNVVSWNAGAQSIKGYESHEIIGSHFSRFYTENDVADGKPERELTKALAHGRCRDEGLRKRKDGTTFWADVIITRIKNERGDVVGFSKVTRDVTARKRAEDAQLQLSMQREDFVATLTHDLKTPVVAANRAIKLMLDGDFGSLTPEQINVLETISDSNDAMYKLITSLLDVYRYDGGLKNLAMKEHDLAAQIIKLTQALSPMALSQQITLKTCLPVEPRSVLCDLDEIRRVIQNLVDNALKFTKAGGTVEISMRQDDDKTEIVVADSGKGIAETDLPKLFQRFWAPPASGRQYASTGLGLYLCRKIVEAHGGAISCSSKYGEGSKFSFFIDANSSTESKTNQ